MTKLICDCCEHSYSKNKVLANQHELYNGLCQDCLKDHCLQCCICKAFVDYDYYYIKDTEYLEMLLNLGKEDEFICPICATKGQEVYSFSHKELENYFDIVDPLEEYGIWSK